MSERDNRTVLVTGGAGFFGGVLKRTLLQRGATVVSIDLEPDPDSDENLTSVRGDIGDKPTVEGLFQQHRFDAVFHCAAMLAHAVKDKDQLWRSNVDGTRNLAVAARDNQARHFVFTSSNCVYASNYDEPVTEDEPTGPIEIYGESKRAAEQILDEYEDELHAVSIRTPTIIDEGRLGLLTILFDFIREGKKVWVVGSGNNRYQFLYAQDLVEACLRASNHEGSGIFNVGSANVKTMREVYESVIQRAGTKSKVASLPKAPTLCAMRMAHKLGISPLGPYQNRMITSSFVFDTTKIENLMGWKPTLTNEEILWRAYRYYDEHYEEIHSREQVSAHRQAAKMGVIRLLKWIS
ncbi:MAG: NAD-dependent epimerase/dehydratase family protein [Planctomycetota bacterium]|jgi:nucleoside-diphosphate-sugar epimerase